MQSVNVKELRAQSVGELTSLVLDLQKEIMQERLRTAGQAAKDCHMKRKIRRDIARIKTVIREKEAAQ